MLRDAQRYRLGVNYNQIPVNRPKVEVRDYHRDGFMRTDGNYGGAPATLQNSQGEWAAQPEVIWNRRWISPAPCALITRREDPYGQLLPCRRRSVACHDRRETGLTD